MNANSAKDMPPGTIPPATTIPAIPLLPPTIAELQLREALRNSAKTHIGRLATGYPSRPLSR